MGWGGGAQQQAAPNSKAQHSQEPSRHKKGEVGQGSTSGRAKTPAKQKHGVAHCTHSGGRPVRPDPANDTNTRQPANASRKVAETMANQQNKPSIRLGRPPRTEAQTHRQTTPCHAGGPHTTTTRPTRRRTTHQRSTPHHTGSHTPPHTTQRHTTQHTAPERSTPHQEGDHTPTRRAPP